MPTVRCGFRSTSLAQPRSRRNAAALDVVLWIARMSVSALRFHLSMPTLWSRATDQTRTDANVCSIPIADCSGGRIDRRSHESVINMKAPRFLVSGRKSVLNQTLAKDTVSFGRSQYPTRRPRANRNPFRREYSDSAVHSGRRRCLSSARTRAMASSTSFYMPRPIPEKTSATHVVNGRATGSRLRNVTRGARPLHRAAVAATVRRR
jgi:hypothetical protein